MSQREILFKAKRADNGDWVEGYLWSKRTIGYTSPVGNTDEIVIDPETVCQFTGMTDKNGRKVFEGDKVRIKYIYLHESKEAETDVIWSNNRCSFSPFNWEHECDGCDCYYEIDEVEVIGNIHDN